MRWPWRRRRECCPPEPSEDARAALVHARRQLVDTERLSERVEEVAGDLDRIVHRNHIAESIAQALRGGA